MSRERKELIQALKHVSTHVAELIRNSDTTIKIPHYEWTVGAAAAHLVITQRLARDILHGGKSPYGKGKAAVIAKVNKKMLKEFTERDSLILAQMFLDEVAIFLQESKEFPDDHTFRTHYGEITLLLGISYCLFHLLSTGYAIARALKKSLPISEDYIQIILPFIKTMMPRIYNKNAFSSLSLQLVINLRGMEKFAVICSEKGAIVEDFIPNNIDCYIIVDPLTFFLITNNFISQWNAFLTGKLVVLGKKPWMAMKLKELFPTP